MHDTSELYIVQWLHCATRMCGVYYVKRWINTLATTPQPIYQIPDIRSPSSARLSAKAPAVYSKSGAQVHLIRVNTRAHTLADTELDTNMCQVSCAAHEVAL